jgi:hypothetical protein
VPYYVRKKPKSPASDGISVLEITRRRDRALTAVCDYFLMKPGELRNGPLRKRGRRNIITIARAVLSWILHRDIGMSSTQTGRYLGRDHSTILSSVKYAAARPQVMDMVVQILDDLRTGADNDHTPTDRSAIRTNNGFRIAREGPGKSISASPSDS